MYYDNLDQAKTVGMEKSKQNLKGYSIRKRNGKDKFYIYGEEALKCHDSHVFFCHNYETPFEVNSISPKSGEHLDSFPTKELANIYYKGLIVDNYRRNIYKNF